VGRDISESNKLGYSMGVNLTPDKCTLTPTLMYQIMDNIKLVSSVAVDSDYGWRLSLGAEYEFSHETKVVV
jgi:long-subunit fatty acid transport protein